MNVFDIVKTARLTEKGTRQGALVVNSTVKNKDGTVTKHSRPLNQYTVVASPHANKQQIRKAVEELFKVKVIKINTMNVTGKMRRQRTVQAGQASNWKKAIVTLKEGDKIILT